MTAKLNFRKWDYNGNNYTLDLEDGFLSYNDGPVNMDNAPELAIAKYDKNKSASMAILYGANPNEFENFKTFQEAIDYATKLVNDDSNNVRPGFWTAWDFANNNWYSSMVEKES